MFESYLIRYRKSRQTAKINIQKYILTNGHPHYVGCSGHHDCLLHLLKVSAIILQETSDLKARDSIHEVGKQEELSTIRHHVKKGS